MVLPPNLHKKYLARFDELTQEGEYLYKAIKDIPIGMSSVAGQRTRAWTQQETECHSQVPGWLIKYQSLLDQIIPSNSIHRQLLTKEETFWSYASQVRQYVSCLKGLKDDFANGFFSDLQHF